MDCSSSNSQGRSMTEEHSHQDRLSQLPNALIILILSLLEMKDAVKTGVLAKRWKNLWTQVDNIVFRYADTNCIEQHMSSEEFEKARSVKLQQFVSFVDLTLLRCTGPKIKSFYLDYVNVAHLHDDESVYAKLSKWIANALEKKVEFLTLRFMEGYNSIPDCLYRSSTLTKLKLDVLITVVYFPVSWTSLKTLYLMNMLIDDLSIKNILVGCPVLETMVLHAVCGINHINILSPSMRKLELIDFHEYGVAIGGILKITAPWIQELKIVERFLITKCELVDVSFLVKATLNFRTISSRTSGLDEESNLRYTKLFKEYNIEWTTMVDELLQSVSHVDELIIGSESIQVLSLSMLLEGPSPFFRKCKHVWITSSLWKFDLPGIVYLLENAPLLETLFIKVVQEENDMPFPQVMEHYGIEKPDFACNKDWEFLHLRTIKIDHLQVNMQTDRHVLAIVRYILPRAAVLEKLVLCSSSGSTFCRQQMLKFSELLDTLLAQNEVAEWVRTEKNGTFNFSFQRKDYN